MSAPDYLGRNRDSWERWARDYESRGRRHWASAEPSWGIWDVPETELRLLPDLAGRDTLELGCGTAYVSSWLVRRGAHHVGLDPTPAQLRTARKLQVEFDLSFPLLLAAAEAVPLRSESFDFILSEYGASIWSDPYLWIPEAARLLRPEGELVFLVNSTLVMLCISDQGEAATDGLKRDYFGLHRFEWADEDDSVEFHLGYGDWIRLFRANGFEVVDLIELKAPEGATTSYDFVTPEWARRWPSEEVWRVRKRP